MFSAPNLPRLATQRRPVIFAACAVLAVMLNASAIGVALSASALSHGAVTGPSDSRLGAAMMLVASREASAPQEGAATGQRVRPSEPAPRQVPSAPQARAAVASPSLGEVTQPVVFYSFREVDNAAFPASDWNLDVASLDAIGVERMVFEVLVSNRGEIVGSSVLAPADLPAEVRRDLEKRISETTMLPASRAGQLVASVRRIELIVADTPLDAPVDLAARRP